MKFNPLENLTQVNYVTAQLNDEGMRLDNYLMRQLQGVPKSHVYRIIRSGEVRINRGRAKPSTRLTQGDSIRIPPVRQRKNGEKPTPPDALKSKVQAAIIYETDAVIALNKPAGLAVHGGSGVPFGLIDVLRALRPTQYLELVHRLDRHTSGCLLVAKSRPALNELQDVLRKRQAQKTYTALVHGQWPQHIKRVELALSRDHDVGGERLVRVDTQHGRYALSHFKVLENFAESSLVEVDIVTGRTHQIRVHAASQGHALAGDNKYADNAQTRRWRAAGLKRLFLHASGIALPFQNAKLEVKAPLPADLQQVLHTLRRR